MTPAHSAGPARPRREHTPCPALLALAGLPGTGKSVLARALAARLFGAAVDYSTAQNGHSMAALYEQAAALLAAGARGVIVDGRTFHAPRVG